MQNERPGGGAGRRGRRWASADRLPGGRGYGADYLYIEPESGTVESSWTVKRQQACMYGLQTPFTREREHRGKAGGGPRTFDDAARAAADALPSYEEAQARIERARNGHLEVIVISDDEVVAGPVMESGGPATRVSPTPGSGDESSSGTLEIDSRGRWGRTEVTFAFTPDGVKVILEFLAAVMVVPDSGWAPDVPGFIGQLRGELKDVAARVARGKQGAEAALLGMSDEAVKRQWFKEESAWFGREKMTVVHRFLSCVVRPTRGGFSLYLARIRHELVAHVSFLERDAARALRLDS